MTEKRFWREYYNVGYYTEIVDNEKELKDVPNPEKNLTIEEIVDKLNKFAEENEQLKKEAEEYNENAMSYQTLYEKSEELLSECKHQRQKFYNENKELKEENKELKETLAFRSNQLALMEQLIDDLGSEEMARQMEEILND